MIICALKQIGSNRYFHIYFPKEGTVVSPRCRRLPYVILPESHLVVLLY